MKLDAVNISKSYEDGAAVLSNVNLSIETGTSVSISAPSGRGKSTLLAILGLLLRPTSGGLLLDGREISSLTDREKAVIRSQNFGFIFQSTQLIGSLTALENVCIPATIARTNATERAKELLAHFGLENRMNYYPHQLSIGQQRRLSVARALLLDPPFILADEPTNDLDPENSEEIMRCLIELPKKKHALILVTHDGEFSARTMERYTLDVSGSLLKIT